uniref:DUF1409 domain-containing protein n=1 Tax=Oryza sativa subsp. japonica TaxID=39947 RepID=Q94I68_ORYSJ|nr:Hypothetical protein [Oryza sativa Japonica Group]
MSSSASPSAAPSAEYAEVSPHRLDPLSQQQIDFPYLTLLFFFPVALDLQHLSNLIAIPSLSHENHYFLGPIGNLDSTDFIIGETNRIPFRLANPNLSHWKNTFKSWPSLEKTTPEKSWITWYQRVSANKKVHWDEIGIGQALDLTIANLAKDEPLMAAASYFWSNTINAFLFNQGPMTPTLIDITMITGLDVTSSANPMSMNTKNQFDFRTKSIGGWSGYMAAYMGQGSVTPREHQFVAEALESKKEFPLGKILLGYLYQTLNNASAKIAVGSVVGAGRPWWLLQTWLNLMVRKVFNQPPVTEAEFPLPEPIVGDDGEERTHHICTSYGEYTSTQTDARAKLSAELLKDWFCSFYEGFRSKNFDRWWGEWKLHLFHQSASMYMTDLFPDVIPQKKKTAVKKKPAATIVKSAPPPPPPPSPPVQQPSSDQTPSAVESHHIEEEEQPAAPAIPISFSLDYLDKAEEDTSSKALAPLSDDLEASSLDSLVVDCGSIRTRLHEVQALIPEELADVLTPAAYLEQHQFKLEKAKLRLAERRERKEIEATIQVNRQLVHEEKVKLDQLSEGPIKSNIDRLEAHKIDLLAQLEECNAELDMEHKKLADLPKSIKEQKARLKSTIKNVADLTKSLKVISGTDAQDAQAIEEVEQIRLSSSTYLNNSCVIGPRNFCNRLRCLNTPLF